MKKYLSASLAFGAALALPLIASGQQTIYSHSFSGGDDPLNGTAVDVGGQSWQSGDLFRANGNVNPLEAGTANGQAAWLPFSPEIGWEYTASVTITNDAPGWIAFGFMPENSPSGSWTDTAFNTRHSNNGAYAWMLYRNDPGDDNQQGFFGPDTNNGAFGENEDASGSVDLDIVLNTMDVVWTASFYINGDQVASGNLEVGAITDIGGIGFSRTNVGDATGVNPGELSDFSLTAVPEPSTYALIFGAAVLGIAVYRRRRTA